MTPYEFERRMKEIYKTYYTDKEARHEKADDLLCELLIELGYEKGIAIFKVATKWYA